MWLNTYDTGTGCEEGRVHLDHVIRIEPARIDEPTEDRYVVQAVMADGSTHTLSAQTYPTLADAAEIIETLPTP